MCLWPTESKYIVTGWRITRQGGVSKCPEGWVYWGFLGCRILSVVGWWSVLPGRLVLVLSSGCPPCRDRGIQWLSSVPCSCAGGWPVKRCFLEYNADSELAWSLLETCLTSVCVAAAYQALPWRASGVPGQPVMRTCRWSSLVSRVTVMSARDTRHNIFRLYFIYTQYGCFHSQEAPPSEWKSQSLICKVSASLQLPLEVPVVIETISVLRCVLRTAYAHWLI